jgi:hypothetical protein
MLAKPKSVASIRRIIRYSEQKITTQEAELILAEGFIKDLPELKWQDKLDRFDQRISLNALSDRKAVHVSVSFSSEDEVNDEQMRVFAKRYMKVIGFEDQPYLVYRHYDSAHPHFHIVSTNIRSDGSQIVINNNALYRSMLLAKKFEIEHSLKRRQTIDPADEEKYKTTQAQRAVHGRDSVKRSISDVLHTVIDDYKYTNLSELNAILRLYNIKANRGNESSRVYQNRGLLFHIIDERGVQVGKSIKASVFLLKPTLTNLEKRFLHNESIHKEHQQRVRTAIDWTLTGEAPDWGRFREDLEQERISVVVQAEKKDGSEGVFFVDHLSKCAFSGESLGGLYLLEALRSKCSQERQELEEEETLRQRMHLGL